MMHDEMELSAQTDGCFHYMVGMLSCAYTGLRGFDDLGALKAAATDVDELYKKFGHGDVEASVEVKLERGKRFVRAYFDRCLSVCDGGGQP